MNQVTSSPNQASPEAAPLNPDQPQVSPVLATTWRHHMLRFLAFLAMAIIFGIAYTQSVLYEGNQNTKFLHGLAGSTPKYQYLAEDWLANTIDPLPVFSALVSVTAHINENLFYFYYFVLFGIYIYSLLGIVSLCFKKTWSWRKSLAVFTILMLIHARWVIKLVGRRYDINLEYLQFGLANQYLLGEEFQNSSFGVLLLLSIYLFLQRKYLWAMLSLGLACILHSAYIFTAAWMTLAYLLIILVENYQPHKKEQGSRLKKLLLAARQPFGLGLLTLALVIPLVWHNQVYLSATSHQTDAEALHILVHLRIPHHAVPDAFIDRNAYAQLGLMVAGLLLARKSRLFVILAALFTGGAIFSAIQILTASDNLAMLGPWRVSVLLVPLATTLLAASLVNLVLDFRIVAKLPYEWVLIPLALWASFVSVQRGLDIQKLNSTSYKVRKVERVMTYALQNQAAGQVYLIPPKDADFDDFRLYTGVPVFINWKSHPYKDTQVLEWYQRVLRADAFYDADAGQKCTVLEQMLREYHLTHVVIKSKEIMLKCNFSTELFRSDNYAIYALTTP